MNDSRVAELLDDLIPRYDGCAGDWRRVTGSARRPRRIVALGAAALAVGTLALVWPFASDSPSLLERARAAIGSGPVLHAVLRGDGGGTLVDLATGERTAVREEKEIWFDTTTRRTHTIERLGGVVQNETVATSQKPAVELTALGREYRQALVDGSARIAGDGEVDGEPVTWVTIRSELLPDVADGKNHEWAQQVAVSMRSYRPVALRETRDGATGQGTMQRVLELQMLPRAAADFTASRASRDATAFSRQRAEIAPADAAAVLGTAPLWLGRGGLTAVYRETTAVGRPTIDRRSNGVVRVTAPTQWRDAQTSVVFAYGDVTLTDSTSVSASRRGIGGYVPPPGSVFLVGARLGYLQRDGLQIAVEAASEQDVLAAARALTPLLG